MPKAITPPKNTADSNEISPCGWANNKIKKVTHPAHNKSGIKVLELPKMRGEQERIKTLNKPIFSEYKSFASKYVVITTKNKENPPIPKAATFCDTPKILKKEKLKKERNGG